MDVKANATRIINERGNQVVIVTGQVDSNSAQPVLPAGLEYTAKILELHATGGSVYFSLEIEAAKGVAVEAAPLPTELTRQEQEDAFLHQQLNDPNLDDASKATIRERLGITENKDAQTV